MTTNSFPYYIEDWIHWFAKRKDDLGNEVDFPYYKSWPIRLANYDIQFITRSSDGFIRGVGLTDRQVTTAVKIITKYKRQIKNKLDRDVDYIATERPLMLPVRDVDRSFKIRSYDHYYFVQFPYLPMLVDKMHKLASESSGDFFWNKDKRAWFIAKTELNLGLLYQFVNEFNKHYWDLDSTVEDHFAIVNEVYNNPHDYVPTVELIDDKLVFNNTNEFLNSTVEYLSKFDIPNVTIRADNYGFAVGKTLEAYINAHYKNMAVSLLTPQHIITDRIRHLDTYFNNKEIQSFMKIIQADYWVFIGYLYNKMEWKSEFYDNAILGDSTGEKIFFTGARGSVDGFVSDICALIKDKPDADLVIFIDNHIVLKRILETPVANQAIKIFYLHGDNKS